MPRDYSQAVPITPRSATFATTHWSVVLTAGQTDSPLVAEALEELCRTYWFPLYVFVRRQGHDAEDAQDLTQDFFARLLEKGYLAKADHNRGKFRTFLLRSLNNFLINEWKRAGRLKRGGEVTMLSFDADAAEERYAAEPIDETNPAADYDRLWAVALIEHVFTSLRGEYAGEEKARIFMALKDFIWGGTGSRSYLDIARQLNLTEGNVKVAVHRLRKRFRELLRAEVAQTVAHPEDIDEELRYLITVAS